MQINFDFNKHGYLWVFNHSFSQSFNHYKVGVASGPGYPFIRLQALATAFTQTSAQPVSTSIPNAIPSVPEIKVHTPSANKLRPKAVRKKKAGRAGKGIADLDKCAGQQQRIKSCTARVFSPLCSVKALSAKKPFADKHFLDTFWCIKKYRAPAANERISPAIQLQYSFNPSIIQSFNH